MSRKNMRKLVALMPLFILSGCATQIEPPFNHPVYQSKPHAIQTAQFEETQNWDIQGSASIQNRDKVQMGSFSWKQIGPRYAINFYGPLNIGAIGIAGQPGKVTLNRPTGSYEAPTAESLMQQQLGWYLPVSNMYFWVRGLKAPGKVMYQKRDEDGHVIYLKQQGWTMHYDEFRPEQGQDLPHKIWMENELLKIKLVIKTWNLT